MAPAERNGWLAAALVGGMLMLPGWAVFGVTFARPNPADEMRRWRWPLAAVAALAALALVAGLRYPSTADPTAFGGDVVPLTTHAHAVVVVTLLVSVLVLFEQGSNTRRVIDQFFLAQQIPMHVAMETESVEIIKAMVASGLGITLIPYAAIGSDMRSKRFGWARVRGLRLYRESGWVYLRSDHEPRPVTEVLRLFEEMRERIVIVPIGKVLQGVRGRYIPLPDLFNEPIQPVLLTVSNRKL